MFYVALVLTMAGLFGAVIGWKFIDKGDGDAAITLQLFSFLVIIVALFITAAIDSDREDAQKQISKDAVTICHLKHGTIYDGKCVDKAPEVIK